MSSRNPYLFTSESVTEGHPDKIADQISDSVLDACLAEDPMSRVACETLTATGLVVIAGEITTKAYVDFQALVRGVIASIGYNNALYGFDSNTCAEELNFPGSETLLEYRAITQNLGSFWYDLLPAFT